MQFNSVDFGVFLVIVFSLYWTIANHRTWRHLLLLAASYFFYGSWNELYLLLIVASTLLDYGVGLALGRERRPARRKWLLAASLIGNLGLLGTFKYYDFFAHSLADLIGRLGLHGSLPYLEVLLPAGISFYTFQTLSYTIDVYRGQLQPTRSLIEFALFVAFFPQLVAGPIVRASQFLPQFERTPTLDEERLGSALYLILKGLFKKIVIADFLAARLVEPVFAHPGAFGSVDTLLAIYGYALQLYGDFSAYTDIAIGSARLLGFDLPINFVAPYLARDLQDFWRRWHITLSTWLRDYVYISLGGSRKGVARAYLNVVMVGLAAGLWHGAAWKFVAWGAMHGLGLAATRFVQRHHGGPPLEPSRLGLALRRLLTFHFVAASMILFRSTDFEAAWQMLLSLTHVDIAPEMIQWPILLAIAIGFGTHVAPMAWKERLATVFTRMPALSQGALATIVLGFFQTMSLNNEPFIYFQF